MNTNHTPTPWSIEKSGGTIPSYLIRGSVPIHEGELNQVVSESRYGLNAEANAAFIVRACNSHADLVEALGAALNAYRDARLVAHGKDWDKPNPIIEQAEAALAKAKF